MRNLPLYACLFIFLGICLVLTPAAAGDDQPNFGTTVGLPEIIKLDSAAPANAKPVIHVLESSADGLLLEFELPEITIQEIDVDGQSFHSIEIAGGAYRGEVGEPMLPTFSHLIQIPDYVGVAIEVTGSETIELAGYKPMPMQPGDPQSFAYDQTAYSNRGYEDLTSTVIGAPAIARDLRVIPITYSPVRYNPDENKIEVASRITARIVFSGIDDRNAAPRQHTIVPMSFNNLYQNLVVNYEGPRDNQVVGLGSYVIICQNNSTIINLLQPLVEWRTRRGYNVTLATTAETGTSNSSIKAWIQEKYDTWENPPEYIVLIGDTSGTLDIAHWNESSNYHGETDHPYVQLAGSDILADAHIGRISVSSYDQLELYVHKIVSYESDPYMDETDWYKTATVTGDPSSSGWTTVQCMQWLQTQLLTNGYSTVHTVFGGSYDTLTLSWLDTGASSFGYRGYWHMSGIDTGDISNLQNGRKMPFAVILTCDTGSFADGFSRSEAFMRGGLPPDIPTAGIASIGTATLGTHTRYNNCVTYGIWHSAFTESNYEFGTMLTRGKYELFLNYNTYEANMVSRFTSWNNLMGDPAGELWTGVPQDLIVSYPADIAIGANSVVVDVSDDGSPLAGAYVCLWKGAETHVGGFTDNLGRIELPVDALTAGNLLLTVTAHNFKPLLTTINVAQEDRFVGYLAHTLDGDGVASPNETLQLQVQVKNFGTLSASSVYGTILEASSYANITDADDSYGTVAAGATTWGSGGYALQIDPTAPNGHLIDIGLETESLGDDWHSLVQLPVVAPEFEYRDITLYDFGTRIDPGETGEISVELKNIGGLNATGVTAFLSTTSDWLNITDLTGDFGNVNIGASVENTVDRFGLSASADCYPGHVADMLLVLETADGMIDSVPFQITVGLVSSSDPTGHDGYGYYAYDNTDIGYPEAPTYDWVEIAANYGGPGTSVGLDDFGSWQDDTNGVSLPFVFSYYGVDHTRVSICSNGWIAMGSTSLANYRNWTIPCAGAPTNMIAVMWDNFKQDGENVVYQWFDETNHRYIVQWSRLRNMFDSSVSTFQIIFYDQEYYPTETGDGIIEMQFHTYNNHDYEQEYSTTGIQNADNTDGLLYSYWNTPTPGSAQIVGGRAIRFIAKEVGLSDAPAFERDIAGITLHQNRPNPFSAAGKATQIRFELSETAKVSLKVYDTAGRLVRTLTDQQLNPGSHIVDWDGSDGTGRQVASGVYYYTLDTGALNQSRQMLILR